jgi:hypothetical protein
MVELFGLILSGKKVIYKINLLTFTYIIIQVNTFKHYQKWENQQNPNKLH